VGILFFKVQHGILGYVIPTLKFPRNQGIAAMTANNNLSLPPPGPSPTWAFFFIHSLASSGNTPFGLADRLLGIFW
jgi:hypothetical protein